MSWDHGIVRIKIRDKVKGRGAWRFESAESMYEPANCLYREIFASLGMPLKSGELSVETDREGFYGGYDYALGIDVILTTENGQEYTLQEKFLTTSFDTVTVEYLQDWRTGEQGDWFKMKANLYFTGYHNGAPQFDRWILLKWLDAQVATARGFVKWETSHNRLDGARASFRYAKFSAFPDDCVLASKPKDKEPWKPRLF